MNNCSQSNYTLNVPKGFGNIENVSEDDPYNPWLAEKVDEYDANGNPVYSSIGTYETFSEALLALIISNTGMKKKRKKKKCVELEEDDECLDEFDDDFLSNKVDEMYDRVNNRLNPGSPLLLANNNPDIIDTPMMSNNMAYSPALDYSNPLMKLTLKEVYERWLHDKQFEDVSEHTIEGYKNTYKKVAHLNDRVFVEIKFSEINDCVIHEKAIGNSYGMRKRVKLFFSQLYQWAIAKEMCVSNLALNIKLGKNEGESTRQPFTPEQIECLFSHVDENPFIETILILIFTGLRCGEFLNIRREDIHMDQRYFIVTESKTKAGRNRMVPIHRRIMKFFRKRLRAKSDYLIHDSRGRQVDYSHYSSMFRKCMERFGYQGMTAHCCRHTLRTLMFSAGCPPQTVRRILGHTIGSDVHDRVYLHIQLQDLIKAIDMI